MATQVIDSTWGKDEAVMGALGEYARQRGLTNDLAAMSNPAVAQAYLDSNPDLVAAGVDTQAEAIRHYALFGNRENRPGAPNYQAPSTLSAESQAVLDTIDPNTGLLRSSNNTIGGGEQNASGILFGMDNSNITQDNSNLGGNTGGNTNQGGASGTDTQTGGGSSGNDTQTGGGSSGGSSGGNTSGNSNTSGTQTSVDYDRIGGLFNTANTGINTANQTLGTINTNLNTANQGIAANTTQLGTIGGNVNDIKTNVGTLGTDLGNFRTDYNSGQNELKGLFGNVQTKLGGITDDISKYSQTTGQDIENLSKDTKSGFAQATENREDIQAQNAREMQRQRNIMAATQNMLGQQGGQVSTQQPIQTNVPSGGATLADTTQASQAINTGANSSNIPASVVSQYSTDPRDQISPVQMATGGIVGNMSPNNLDKSMNSSMTIPNNTPGIMGSAMPQPKPQDPLAGLRRLMNRGKKKVV